MRERGRNKRGEKGTGDRVSEKVRDTNTQTVREGEKYFLKYFWYVPWHNPTQ